MQIEINKMLLAEIEEAAEFEQKSLEDYVDFALRIALKRTENKRLEPEKVRRFNESYEKFPDQPNDFLLKTNKWKNFGI
jgi:hypothetical protein